MGDVRLSKRLTESAACLVADGEAMTAHFERLMTKLGRNEEESKRVLELNGEHPVVAGVCAILHGRTPPTLGSRRSAGCCTSRR